MHFAARAENAVCQDAAAQTPPVLMAPEPRASVYTAAARARSLTVLNSARGRGKKEVTWSNMDHYFISIPIM